MKILYSFCFQWDFQSISHHFQKLIRVCNDEKDIYFLNICHVLLLALQKIGITRTLDNKSIDLKDSLVYRVRSTRFSHRIRSSFSSWINRINELKHQRSTMKVSTKLLNKLFHRLLYIEKEKRVFIEDFSILNKLFHLF